MVFLTFPSLYKALFTLFQRSVIALVFSFLAVSATDMYVYILNFCFYLFLFFIYILNCSGVLRPRLLSSATADSKDFFGIKFSFLLKYSSLLYCTKFTTQQAELFSLSFFIFIYTKYLIFEKKVFFS